MHTIEPFVAWQHLYDATADRLSPFYGRKYQDSRCIHTIYNYYIHPQWDEFGSSTLYLKILYTDYLCQYSIIELLGEWNDTLYNDIMFLKRDVADLLIEQGIRKFILIGENVLNFHASENDYYQEWADDVEDGWIAILNLRKHVIDEFRQIYVDRYVSMGNMLNLMAWRPMEPSQLLDAVEHLITKKLDSKNFLPQ